MPPKKSAVRQASVAARARAAAGTARARAAAVRRRPPRSPPRPPPRPPSPLTESARAPAPALFVPASKASALAGRNPYSTPREALAEVVASYHPLLLESLGTTRGAERAAEAKVNLVHETVRARGEEPPSPRCENQLRELEELAAAFPAEAARAEDAAPPERHIRLDSVAGAAASVTAPLEFGRDALAERVDEGAAAAAAATGAAAARAAAASEKVAAAAERSWMLCRGVRLESGTLDRAADAVAAELAGLWPGEGADAVSLERCDALHKAHIEIAPARPGSPPRRFVLGGRVDAVVRGQDGEIRAVIEVKNRRNRFFTPGYDLDQLAAYCQLTGAAAGVLVQQYDGDIRATAYAGDDLRRRWEDVERGIADAVAFFGAAVSDPRGDAAVELARLLEEVPDRG